MPIMIIAIRTQPLQCQSHYKRFNPYIAEIFLYKSWRPKGVLRFEVNVFVNFFRFIWIPVL